MNTKDKLEEIISFVAEETSIPSTRILPSSRLYHDLGIYGDDAHDLMRSFSKRFGVDMHGFDFRKHFDDEPSLLDWVRLIRNIALRIGGRPARERLKPVTITEMVRAAEEGKWPDPSP